MRRDHALLVLREHISPDDIVVAVYQACFDWIALSDHQLTYVSTGAMGQAISHGLGLALACPERTVHVFDGDGSLLMNLGGLVTASGSGAMNLHHVVFCNDTYEVNGGHPLPGRGPVDFAAIARAAGYADAATFDDLDDLHADLPTRLYRPGPNMTVLRIVPGASFPRDYDYIHSSEARAQFRAALAALSAPE